jgi:hypothetical protein
MARADPNLPSPLNFMRFCTKEAPARNSSSSGTVRTLMINDLHGLTHSVPDLH